MGLFSKRGSNAASTDDSLKDSLEKPSGFDSSSGDEGGVVSPQEEETLQVNVVDPSEYPGGYKLFLVVTALLLGYFLVALDLSIVGTAIPKITDQFHQINDVSWYGSAFMMTTGGFQSSWGKAYKYFSLKITFLLAIFVFEVGSLICGVAPSSVALIVGRAVAGVGAAGISTGVLTMIAVIIEPKKRSAYLGVMGVAYGIASVVGPVVGGAFAGQASWRWCFYINLPIGAIAAFIIVFALRIPKSYKPAQATLKEKILQMDLGGTALVMGAVICLILALQYGGVTKPWSSSTVIGLFVGFVLLTVAFAIWEVYQGERAAISRRLISDRNVWVNSVYTMWFAGSYFIMVYYLPIYFQAIDGSSPTDSGVRNLPLIIAVSLCVILSGFVVSATGVAAPIMPIAAVLATVGAGLLYTLDVGTGTGKWIGYQIVGGVGWGLGFQVPVMIGQGTAKPMDIPSVTAIILFFQTIGAAFCISAAQAAWVNQLVKRLPISAPSVNMAKVIASGATQLEGRFSSAQLLGIRIAYMSGLKGAFAVAIAAAGISFFVSLCSKWTRMDPEKMKNTGGA